MEKPLQKGAFMYYVIFGLLGAALLVASANAAGLCGTSYPTP